MRSEFNFGDFDGSDDFRHEPAFDFPAEYAQVKEGVKTDLVFQSSQNGFDELSAGIEVVLPEGTLRGGVRLAETDVIVRPDNNLRVQVWVDLNRKDAEANFIQGRQLRLSIQGVPYLFQVPSVIAINPYDDRADPLPYFIEEHIELMGMRTPTEEGHLLVGKYALQGTQVELLPKVS